MKRGLGRAKALGAMGSILTLLAGSVSLSMALSAAIIGLIGLVLFLAWAPIGIMGVMLIVAALNYVSDETGEPKIFSNALCFATAYIVGLLPLAFLWSFPTMPALEPDVRGLASRAALILAWAALLVSSCFLWRSFALVAEKTGVRRFFKAGLLYIVGAALGATGSILPAGGIEYWGGVAIIYLMAVVLTIVAFLSLPEAIPSPREGSAP